MSDCYLYPSPEPCHGIACANPGLTLDYQDFTVIQRQSDGRYFRFAKSNTTGEGLSVATAQTLRGTWEFNYTVLGGPLKDKIVTDRSATNVWAPEIHYVNNLYYLYYSVEIPSTGQFDLCVATSPSMDNGAWTDHGSMGVPTSRTTSYVRLDGNLLSNDSDPSGVDGQHYMVFGSYLWGIYGFRVSANLLKIKSGATVDEIIIDQYNSIKGSDPATDAGNKTEGAFQLRHGEYIYLFYSRGDCCAPASYSHNTVYRVQVCRSTSAGSPLGPYFDRDGVNCLTGGQKRNGTDVLASHDKKQIFAPGSVGVLDDPAEGGLVMYYQYENTTDLASPGLRFGFNYLEFDAEEWPMLVAKRNVSSR